MSKAVFSKAFSEKLRSFDPGQQADLTKAVERVLLDPDLNQYKRPYLDPYRQEHPTDKTLTLFFVVPSKPQGRVFFVWVNDDRHPHDTHKNHGDDPCVKEFIRLRASDSLEQYSEKEHEGDFSLSPLKPKTVPTFYKFTKYKSFVYSNVSFDSVTYFSMAITTMNQPHEIFDHYKLFIAQIREHFLNSKQPFEFRVMPGDLAFQQTLQDNANPAHWIQTQDGGMTIWAIK
jgi:hypothetical protein